MNHDVFISYSRKDYVDEEKNIIPGNEVSKIKEALTKVGITYWFDEDGVYSGQNFVEKIVTNIEEAKIFLFLSTSNANKSSWTCKEIASADELNKYIIPVRIDPTPYNKKVLFRIADLDYIEYYTNPHKGMEDIIKSIQAYLEEIAAEEKRKKEEENKRIELERKKQEELKREKELEEEQEQLVAEMIRQLFSTLNNEEKRPDINLEIVMKIIKLLRKLGYYLIKREETELYKVLKERIHDSEEKFYCRRCGSVIYKHQIFCNNCGLELKMSWDNYKYKQRDKKKSL